MYEITPRPSDDEAAAVLAAIGGYLADEAARGADNPYDDWHWSASAALITQGLQPMRAPLPLSWSRVERFRRAGQGGMGITGM